MLDTARNFIPIPDILKVKHIHNIWSQFYFQFSFQLIDSMSYSKQNVFHWHLTDSQSFPLLMPSLPDFVRFGAYRPDQVYMPDQVLIHYSAKVLWRPSYLHTSFQFYHYFVAKIYFLVKVKELVEYARERGVQVKL